MLDEKGFDSWAGDYDRSVAESNEEDVYPFAGYEQLLSAVEAEIPAGCPLAVLDIGFGTGTLTRRLCQAGHEITGIDFSEEMVRAAGERMPRARLLKADFSNGLPPELSDVLFDRIISTYALHHLTDEEKLRFIEELFMHLKPGGKILIGDISFLTQPDLLRCKEASGGEWDDDEHYFVYEELRSALPCGSSYMPVSFCAGVLKMEKGLR